MSNNISDYKTHYYSLDLSGRKQFLILVLTSLIDRNSIFFDIYNYLQSTEDTNLQQKDLDEVFDILYEAIYESYKMDLSQAVQNLKLLKSKVDKIKGIENQQKEIDLKDIEKIFDNI